MITGSLDEQRNYLYFNNAFSLILGIKKDKLLEHGWQFWYQNITPRIANSKKQSKEFFTATFSPRAYYFKISSFIKGQKIFK